VHAVLVAPDISPVCARLRFSTALSTGFAGRHLATAICLDDDAKDKAVCLDSDGEDKAVCPDDDAKDKAGPQAAAVFGPQEEELERVPTVADGRCFWNALLLGTQTTAELELWKLRERNEQGFAVDPAICAQEVKMIKDFAMGLPLSSGAMKRIASAEMPEWSDMVEASKALQCNLVFYTGDAAGATCFIPEPMHAAWRTTKLYAGPSIDGAGHRASHFDLLLRIVAPEAAHKNPAAEATIQISELPDEPNPEERMMKRETDSPAPDTPVPSLPEEQGTINGECPVCRLVYYRIRKGEQCFDCRATLWTVDASSGKVVAPEACGNVQSAVTNLQARLSAEAATRLGAAIGEPVVVMGRDGALVKVALSSGDEAWVNEAEVQEPKRKAAAKPKEVKEPKSKAAAKPEEVKEPKRKAAARPKEVKEPKRKAAKPKEVKEPKGKAAAKQKEVEEPEGKPAAKRKQVEAEVAAAKQKAKETKRKVAAKPKVAEACSGKKRPLRQSDNLNPGTVEERRHLQQAARELAADGDRAWLPSQLAAHLAGQGRAVTMNTRSLRRQVAQLQGFRLISNRGKTKRQAKAVTAPSDWQACVAANQDPDHGLLCFVSTPPSGSFVAVLPPLLNEVASIHAHGYLGSYSVSADCTFRVEVDDWVYLLVTASLHRMLDGRWRRSGLPVLFARHPVETNELYAVAFAALRTALDRRLEHFFRNLSKKTVRDLETGETIKVPKLKKSQLLRVVTRHLHKLARLPTLSMFLLLTKTWLDRMEHCWEERDFAAYLKRQYFVERPLNEAIYGWPRGLGASWWYGMTSAVLQGHPASQQQAEASHRQFKRCVGRSPNARLPDVIKRIKNAVALWVAATSHSESSYVLRTDAGFTGGVPLSPDDWMIQRHGTGLWRHHLPGVGTMILPALWRLQEDARKTPASVQERARGAARMFIMRTGCPASVDPAMADAMLAQVITKKIPQLQALLLQHGILTPFEHPIASHRISFEKLTDMWTEHCIVSHAASSAPSSSSAELPRATMCSCWYFLRKGHCPHAYYIQERLAIRMFGEIPLPSAAHAPATFKDDGDASSVEAAGRVRKRHPKRKRPQYKPRPVLPVLGVEQEAHVLPLPKRAARVMQPQKAKRSVFQR
ncbi:unnamed protein product, partial [Symbiodinium microadriaticum]